MTEDAFAAMDIIFAAARAIIVAAIFLAIVAASLDAAFAACFAAVRPTVPFILATPNLIPAFVARRACIFAINLTPVLAMFIALNALFIATFAPSVSPSPARNLNIAGEMARMRDPASPLAMSRPVSITEKDGCLDSRR